jgi:hypothetical protein
MKTQKLLSGMLALLAFTACRVTMVPDHNEALERQIITAQKANDRLYLDMLAVPETERKFELFISRYVEIESEINSILFQNKARQKSEDFVTITENLKNKFRQYKEEHKAAKTLKDAEITAYQAGITAMCKPLILAERSFKDVKN